jgi:hypothetical protein
VVWRWESESERGDIRDRQMRARSLYGHARVAIGRPSSHLTKWRNLIAVTAPVAKRYALSTQNPIDGTNGMSLRYARHG